MTRLVVGGQLAILLADHRALSFGAHENLVLRKLERWAGNLVEVLHCRLHRGGVDEVVQIRAGEAGRSSRQCVDVHGRLVVRLVLEVKFEDFATTLDIGIGHSDVPVESARTRQRRVERLWQVRRREHNHALIRLEAVHLHKKLVQRLARVTLPLLARSTHAVELVDEYDARGLLLRRLEQRAHTPASHSHEHLLEFASRAVQERNSRLASRSLGEQSFPRSRRSC
mmetsp:Transcript_3017/g.6712  ORF Transcript_3017/g.6712 Transcript_3017/m.6712 type:complete len:226 (-) Transcript_3017:302-979(-)